MEVPAARSADSSRVAAAAAQRKPLPMEGPVVGAAACWYPEVPVALPADSSAKCVCFATARRPGNGIAHLLDVIDENSRHNSSYMLLVLVDSSRPNPCTEEHALSHHLEIGCKRCTSSFFLSHAGSNHFYFPNMNRYSSRHLSPLAPKHA
jgi:hypothetical protein